MRLTLHHRSTFLVAGTGGRHALTCQPVAVQFHDRNQQFPSYYVLTTLDLAIHDLAEHHERWVSLNGYLYTAPFGDVRWQNPQLQLKIKQHPQETIERALAIILLQNGVKMYLRHIALWWGPVVCKIVEIGKTPQNRRQMGHIFLGRLQDQQYALRGFQ